MRSLSSIPLIVAAAIVAVIAYYRVEPTAADTTSGYEITEREINRSAAGSDHDSFSSEFLPEHTDNGAQVQETELLLAIEAYEDVDYGFSVAIPSGWRKIVAAESPDRFSELEPGYAVGFESPGQGEHDKFADYVLIEVLPGTDSGLFETDGKNRRLISIDGQSTWMDRLDVHGEKDGLTEVDLTIFQAQLSGLGYTVAFYAIGEPSREKLMSDAFELMVRTFRQTSPPFPTS